MRNVSRKTATRRASVAREREKLRQVPPEAAVAYLLKQLHHTVRQALDEALRREKLAMSFAHLGTLYMLEMDPGLPGAELARRGSVTAQTVNGILRRLEQDGLIEREPHPTSARSDSWFLTPAGQKHLARGKEVGGRVCRRLLSPLSTAEMEQFQDYLIRCITGMEMPIDDDARAAIDARTAAKKKSRRT